MKGLFKVILLSCFLAVVLSQSDSSTVYSGDETTTETSTAVLTRLEIIPEETSKALLFEDSHRGGRIVYGSFASTNQFPHFGYAVLHRTTGSTFCGSALISQLWVVTAAHCMFDCVGSQIYFGSTDKQLMTTSRSAYGYTVHQSYDKPSALMNDIALIKLTSTVALSASVQPIQLPARSEQSKNYAGLILTVVGFGMTTTEYPRYLHYTYLSALSNPACLAAHWVFRDTMLCAKSAYASGSGMCFGDSGGPLSVPVAQGEKTTLVGINSYVQTSDCISNVQGFTRVDRYLDWISGLTGISIRW